MPQVTIKSNADADFTHQSGGDLLNDGAGSRLRVYYDGTILYRSLVRFDLSSIPTNATVTAATITLTYDGANYAGSFTISAYKVLRAWGEGVEVLTTAATGECSYIAAKTNVDNWATAGCSNTTTDRSGTAEDTKAYTVGGNWVMTPTLATVQGWVTTPSTNYGLLVKHNEPAGTNYIYFYSNDIAGSEPTITVTYTLPSGGNPSQLMTMNIG